MTRPNVGGFNRNSREDRIHHWCKLIATGVSFALCLGYLLVLPFHPAGLAALLSAGTLILMALGRRDDIVTTGITTTVAIALRHLIEDRPFGRVVLVG